MGNGERYNHESYGQAVFSRRQSTGHRRFFGSALTMHYNTVALTISRCEREHGLAHDWFYPREQLIEVEFTAAQFAELLTTMNVAGGVPCTIRGIGRASVAEPPETPTESDAVRSGFKADMHKIAAKMSKLRDDVAAAMAGKTITQAARKTIVSAVDNLIQDVQSNLPFVLDSFQEAADKVASAAKAEVEAFTMHAIVSAGLDKIREMGRGADVPETPILGEGDKS